MMTNTMMLRGTMNGKKIGAARIGSMTTSDATTGPLRPREAQAPLDGLNHQRRIPRGLRVHWEAPQNS